MNPDLLATYVGLRKHEHGTLYFFNVRKNAALYGNMEAWRAAKKVAEEQEPGLRSGYYNEAADLNIYQEGMVEREAWAAWLDDRFAGLDGANYCWGLVRRGSPSVANFQITVDRLEVAEAFAAEWCEQGTTIA